MRTPDSGNGTLTTEVYLGCTMLQHSGHSAYTRMPSRVLYLSNVRANGIVLSYSEQTPRTELSAGIGGLWSV